MPFKIIKISWILLFSSVLITAQSQEMDYSWPLPEKWKKEVILFPLDFAPTLQYPGVEEVHFTPGWMSDSISEQRWSYLFYWKLDTLLNADTKQLKTDLLAYFNGLTTSVYTKTKSNLTFQPPSIQEFKKLSDEGLYRGKITIMDVFFSLNPINLNFKISASQYPKINKTIICFEFSPQSFDHPVWKELDKQKVEFKLLSL
ncbi:MAG: hypothetical protein WCO93_05790 [bacterium]